MSARAAIVLACGLLGAFPARASDPLAGLAAPPSGGLRVYLVRHGQALSNLSPKPELTEEQLDHLTELGLRQAQSAGQALAARGITAVTSSPAVRAQETARTLARELGPVEVAVDPRLRPLAVGTAPDGRTLDFDERIAEWKAGRDPSPPGGESMERVGERVGELVLELARARPGSCVVLVAHSEVIGAYLGRVGGIPPTQRYPPGIGNGSITVVDVADKGHETIVLRNHIPTGGPGGTSPPQNKERQQQP